MLVGVVAASIFWRYTSYGHDQLAQPAAEDVKIQTVPGAGTGGTVSLKKLATQAMGSRYQMVTDGKQMFLVDLQNGRVWRYFHNTKEGGFSKEDEGFSAHAPVLCRPEALRRLGGRAASRPPREILPKPHRRGSSRNEPGVAAGPGLGRVHPGGRPCSWG